MTWPCGCRQGWINIRPAPGQQQVRRASNRAVYFALRLLETARAKAKWRRQKTILALHKVNQDHPTGQIGEKVNEMARNSTVERQKMRKCAKRRLWSTVEKNVGLHCWNTSAGFADPRDSMANAAGRSNAPDVHLPHLSPPKQTLNENKKGNWFMPGCGSAED